MFPFDILWISIKEIMESLGLWREEAPIRTERAGTALGQSGAQGDAQDHLYGELMDEDSEAEKWFKEKNELAPTGVPYEDDLFIKEGGLSLTP